MRLSLPAPLRLVPPSGSLVRKADRILRRDPRRAVRKGGGPPCRATLRHAGKQELKHLAQPLLGTLILSLSEVSAAPTAFFLFAEGMVGIHHVWRAHRMAKKAEAHEDAKLPLREFEKKLGHLPPERAQEVLIA